MLRQIGSNKDTKTRILGRLHFVLGKIVVLFVYHHLQVRCRSCLIMVEMFLSYSDIL